MPALQGRRVGNSLGQFDTQLLGFALEPVAGVGVCLAVGVIHGLGVGLQDGTGQLFHEPRRRARGLGPQHGAGILRQHAVAQRVEVGALAAGGRQDIGVESLHRGAGVPGLGDGGQHGHLHRGAVHALRGQLGIAFADVRRLHFLQASAQGVHESRAAVRGQVADDAMGIGVPLVALSLDGGKHFVRQQRAGQLGIQADDGDGRRLHGHGVLFGDGPHAGLGGGLNGLDGHDGFLYMVCPTRGGFVRHCTCQN